jgi:hypothetical protein
VNLTLVHENITMKLLYAINIQKWKRENKSAFITSNKELYSIKK